MAQAAMGKKQAGPAQLTPDEDLDARAIDNSEDRLVRLDLKLIVPVRPWRPLASKFRQGRLEFSFRQLHQPFTARQEKPPGDFGELK